MKSAVDEYLAQFSEYEKDLMRERILRGLATQRRIIEQHRARGIEYKKNEHGEWYAVHRGSNGKTR